MISHVQRRVSLSVVCVKQTVNLTFKLYFLVIPRKVNDDLFIT